MDDEMAITSRDIEIVQADWERVLPIREQAAEYGRLFEIAPEVQPLFRTDLKEQGRKLMQVLGVAVTGLSNLGDILPTVRELGRRHTGHGVAAEHYQPVGAALLWTLQQVSVTRIPPSTRLRGSSMLGIDGDHA